MVLTPRHLKSSDWVASKTLVTFDICAMKTTTMIMWRWDLWSARENSICWDGANEVSFYFLSLHTNTHTTAQTHIHTYIHPHTNTHIHNISKCTHVPKRYYAMYTSGWTDSQCAVGTFYRWRNISLFFIFFDMINFPSLESLVSVFGLQNRIDLCFQQIIASLQVTYLHLKPVKIVFIKLPGIEYWSFILLS